MKAIVRNTVAILALAAAVPASASTTTWVDFEWYADVGRPNVASIQSYPAPRAGYIWAPARYEWNGGPGQVYRPGAWIVDDYDAQWRYYAFGNAIVIANGPLVLRDRDGNVIPTNPEAYPVGSAGR
jgi:hypothetical protein